MKKILSLTIAIIAILCFPIIGTAQKSILESLKYNEWYQEDSDDYCDCSLLFKSDGTGVWEWEEEEDEYDFLIPYKTDFLWKKNSDKIIITLKNPRYGKTIVEVRIINATTIKVNGYGDHWTTYKVKDGEVK